VGDSKGDPEEAGAWGGTPKKRMLLNPDDEIYHSIIEQEESRG
jgi:hypothetical protein